MATINHYTPKQRAHIAERLGKLFGLTNPAEKINRDGFHLEHAGDRDQVRLTITCTTFISVEEAQAILNATPLQH